MLWTIIIILVVLWLLGFFRSIQPKHPENRQLDSYAARYRHNPCRIEPSRGDKPLVLCHRLFYRLF